MKKLVTLAVAGLMVAGGALVSAPAASAYPVNRDPAARIVGSNTLSPEALSAARALNFRPGCSARITFTRVGRDKVLATRTRTISANGSATFAFRAPPGTGRFIAEIKQVRAPGCAGFSATARFRVVR